MKRRKLVATVIALVLALSMLSTAVLADTWDLSKGSISIEVTGDTQTVSQVKGETKTDLNPIITSNGKGTENYILIGCVEEGATAKVTIKDTVASTLAIGTVEGDHAGKAEIILQGNNTFADSVSVSGDGEMTAELTGEKDSTLTTDIIGGYSEAGDVTIRLEGLDITVDSGIIMQSAGNSTVEIKDSKLHGNAELEECGIMFRTEGDGTLKIEDSDITLKAEDEALLLIGKGDMSIEIVDSDVTSEGKYPLYCASAGGGEASVVIDNSNVKLTGTSDTLPPMVLQQAESETAGTSDPGTFELTNATYKDPEQTYGDYIFETFTAGVIVDKYGNAVFGTVEILANNRPGPEPEPTESSIYVIANEDGTFTVKGAPLKQFVRLKVDGKTLTEGDFTLTEENGALKLAFSDAFLASLEAGAHTAEIVFGNSYALFTVVK